jgi:hypothetical protein
MKTQESVGAARAFRVIRVFVSSTFRDMQAERDHLVRFVFPRLREELLERSIHLVPGPLVFTTWRPPGGRKHLRPLLAAPLTYTLCHQLSEVPESALGRKSPALSAAGP